MLIFIRLTMLGTATVDHIITNWLGWSFRRWWNKSIRFRWHVEKIKKSLHCQKAIGSWEFNKNTSRWKWRCSQKTQGKCCRCDCSGNGKIIKSRKKPKYFSSSFWPIFSKLCIWVSFHTNNFLSENSSLQSTTSSPIGSDGPSKKSINRSAVGKKSPNEFRTNLRGKEETVQVILSQS